jgi:crotonobetainyl-CoA:carnitine CoA-transferase CaiB-like acyl-CoA transferase
MTSGPSGLSSLAGLRVVEMGVWVAAPSAAALLADWGADVIKVEPPTGDPIRGALGSLGIGDRPNPAFAQDNRGKRSVVLDLRQPEAKEALEELLASADVFVSNLRPDALDGLGLEPEATVARHPHLVYCSMSGYGLRGDDRNRPAYDIGAFWARTGLSVQLATNAEGVPLNARGGIGDHICGLAGLAGILAAILEQRLTGRGRVVEVSLLRTGSYILGWDLSLQAALGKVAPAEAREVNQTPFMNSYRAQDGRWFFFMGLEADRHIEKIYRALGREDLHQDPRFADARSLRKNRGEVIALLDEIIGAEPLAVWAERFDREGVWWAPALGPAEVLEDAQLAANNGFVDVDLGDDGGTQRLVNGPVGFSDATVGPAGAAPRLGEHTDAVLEELAERRESRRVAQS